MKLKFTRDWRGHKQGEIYDVDAGVAEVYIQGGHALLIEGLTPNPVLSGLAQIVKRGRGRPRKNAACPTL